MSSILSTFFTADDVTKPYESSGNTEGSALTTGASPNTTAFLLDLTSSQDATVVEEVSTLKFTTSPTSENILNSSTDVQRFTSSPSTILQTTPDVHTDYIYSSSPSTDLLTTSKENISEISTEPTSAQSFSPEQTFTSLTNTTNFTSTTVSSVPSAFSPFSPLQFGLLIGGSGLGLILIITLIVLLIKSCSRKGSFKRSKSQSDGWISNSMNNQVFLSVLQHRQSFDKVDEDVESQGHVDNIEEQTINVFENPANDETEGKTETMRRGTIHYSDNEDRMDSVKRASTKRELTPVRVPTLKPSQEESKSTTSDSSHEKKNE